MYFVELQGLERGGNLTKPSRVKAGEKTPVIVKIVLDKFYKLLIKNSYFFKRKK